MTLQPLTCAKCGTDLVGDLGGPYHCPKCQPSDEAMVERAARAMWDIEFPLYGWDDSDRNDARHRHCFALARAAIAAACPEGWVCVPREPAQDVLARGVQALRYGGAVNYMTVLEAWRAMLAASPSSTPSPDLSPSCPRCETMRKALLFYADIENWRTVDHLGGPTRIVADVGDRARAALQEQQE